MKTVEDYIPEDFSNDMTTPDIPLDVLYREMGIPMDGLLACRIGQKAGYLLYHIQERAKTSPRGEYVASEAYIHSHFQGQWSLNTTKRCLRQLERDYGILKIELKATGTLVFTVNEDVIETIKNEIRAEK